MKRVLVTCAHSDDAVIGCGGTIKELTDKGIRVLAVSVCGDRIDGFDMAMTMLGADFVALKNSYGKIDDDVVVSDLRKVFEDFNPDLIFTHWTNEILYDHGLVSKHVINLARQYERDILLYELPATSVDFTFDVAIDITRSYAFKLKALFEMKNAFDGEVFKNEVLPAVVYAPGYRGITTGCRYAEVFKSLGIRKPLSPYGRKLIDIEKLV
ncbi:MAG TPA: PIG-L family deacetylase [Fervidobacterium sp.]|nr:hypothetical protein [Fervidobacterium sp.]HOK87711.1 PIG-L family deacetylase [Fervidobacterium sp.]HOM74050.1 PIG-L family deacetylase [Fervidobacterium sp.]HPP17691.1 PIG-L family deacetylase [Fervidobacterium sp.]HRD20272.1 PIG-L family deacetylase [Fervidobacterium sp.]